MHIFYKTARLIEILFIWRLTFIHRRRMIATVRRSTSCCIINIPAYRSHKKEERKYIP